jgi:hypothetical protein
MRIPTNSMEMKHIESSWLEKFVDEKQSIRFGLAMDRVNPYSQQSSVWSTWPMVLINYNIPP